MNRTDLIRIIIADDHDLFRDGFATNFQKADGIDLVAEARNGEQLINLTNFHKPDVVLTDIRMPLLTGIEAARIIRGTHPEIGIIALTVYDDNRYIMEMLEAGANGYLLKNSTKIQLSDAIKTVYRGDTYYCPSTTAKLASLIAANRFDKNAKVTVEIFTDEEKKIIIYICKEYSSKEIADFTGTPARRVEWARIMIMRKMKVKGTAGIVRYAMLHGLYSSGPGS